MLLRIVFLISLYSFVFEAFSQKVPGYRFEMSGSLKGAAIGAIVSDVNDGTTLYSLNGDLLLAPASTVKLILSAVALELLGKDFRFETSLAIQGKGEIVNGSLSDNLIVKGGGDPTLASSLFGSDRKDLWPFEKWIVALKSMGIERIGSDILLDISAFQRWDLPASWAWDDVGNYYGAGPSAINYADNTIRLYFDSPSIAGTPAFLTHTDYNAPGVEWLSEVESSQVNRDLAYVFGSPWDKTRIIRGSIPVNRNNFVVKASMPDPEILFGEGFKTELKSEFPEFDGEVLVSLDPLEGKVIEWHKSPELSEVCSLLNHESVNLIAESLVTQIAYRKNGAGSHEDGIQLIRQFLKNRVAIDSFFLEDGSGLSRFNALSVQQMNALLLYMQNSPNRDVFKNSLPVAGNGTLASFSSKDFPGKTLRAKSGSMTRVRSYAGYLQCSSGREVAFSLIINNFSGTQLEAFKEIRKFLMYVRSSY